jgi:CO/xanthine dehydrogenase FAD-binding subunit
VETPSRIELANRRLRMTRIAVGIAATAAFVAFGAAARAAHPGSSHSSTAATSATATDDTSQSTFDFGAGSFGGSTDNSGSVQSGGS